MSTPVDPTEVETIVGAHRHPTFHLARITRGPQPGSWQLVILHPQYETTTDRDLTTCAFSTALDALAEDGELPGEWDPFVDQPGVPLGIDVDGVLWPGDIALECSGGGSFGVLEPIRLLKGEAP